jgi:hypothetical protein
MSASIFQPQVRNYRTSHKFLKSSSPYRHHQGEELSLHVPDLHRLCPPSHKNENLIDQRGHVGYWSFHLRSTSGIHSSANAMYPVRGPDTTTLS